MNTICKGLLKRALVCLLSAMMIITCPLTGAQEVEAGLITNVLGCAWSKIAMNTVERSVMWGLGRAESATSNDSLASVLNMAQHLISGEYELVPDEILSIVTEMSAEMSALYTYTVDSNNEIRDMLDQLATNDYKNAFVTNAYKPVDNFASQYSGMVYAFNDLVSAIQKYGTEPNGSNRQQLENCYNRIYSSYYQGTNTYDQFTRPLLGDSTTPGFLAVISPYNQNQSVSDELDMTDPSRWQMRPSVGIDTTYLGYYRNYITSVTDFQNNVYDSMKGAASVADNAAWLYIQAYRCYAELQAIMIASDSSLSESEQRSKTTALWNGFFDASYKLVRGLNQMYDTQADVFTTFMRSWDVRATRRIDGYQSPVKFKDMYTEYQEANGYDGITNMSDVMSYNNAEMYPSVIQEDQHIYQFRLVSNRNRLYAIRSSTGNSTEGDGISRAFYPIEAQMKKPTDSSGSVDKSRTCPSTDLMTVLKGLEGGFAVPADISELNAITQSTAYQNSKRLTENIGSELAFMMGSENVHIPDVVYADASTSSDKIKQGPNYLVLRSEIVWGVEDAAWQNPDADITFGNVSMPYSPSCQAKLDLEDTIWDRSGELADKEMVVMWVSDGFSPHIELKSDDGGVTLLNAGDLSLSGGESASVTSGTAMTILARPNAGYTISSVRLLDKDGNILEELFAPIELSSGTQVSTQEMMEYMKPDDEGYYAFSVPAPYRDARVDVSYTPADKSLVSYTATLRDSVNSTGNYDAVLQFGGCDYLGQKAFKAGDQVTVSVCGYNDHIASGLTFTDASGKAVELEYKDISAEMKLRRPTERLFTFKMPAEEITVSAVLGATHPVSVIDSRHCSHTFRNLNVPDLDQGTDWAHASKVDFAAGSKVTIGYEPDQGYIVTQIEVFDSSNNIVPARILNGDLVFTMPDKPVTVRFADKSVNIHQRTLILDSEHEAVSFQFKDKYGDNKNTASAEFTAGDTVNVYTDVQNGYMIRSVTLIAEDSADDIFKAQDGKYDIKTGVITLTMPETNAKLSAVIIKKPGINEIKKITPVIFRVSSKSLKKSSRTYSIKASDKFGAKKTFKLTSVSGKAKKYIKVSSNGKLTLKKGLKKGSYRIRVKISAAAGRTFAKTSKTAVMKIVVK